MGSCHYLFISQNENVLLLLHGSCCGCSRPMDEFDANMFHPAHAQAANYGGGNFGYERSELPGCWGECFAGRCKLDRREPGCCRAPPANHHPQYAAVQGSRSVVAGPVGSSYYDGDDAGDKEQKSVYCWEGTKGAGRG